MLDQKEIPVSFFYKIEKESWDNVLNESQNQSPIIKRLIANLNGLYIVNSTLIVDYIGPEDKKKIFSMYFIKYIEDLKEFLKNYFKSKNIIIDNVVSIKRINLEVLKEKWIEYVLSLKNAKDITILIKKG